ncbi:threonine dehydratase [Desertihabitans brevis]|uniref:L-threonine dehydratase n=2 Tax=Desertihabitans brevis TaxID=2268447 RepID=A0A367Z032_9ACTN|nr:threonine dehydratase [Desertihabitans brevis]
MPVVPELRRPSVTAADVDDAAARLEGTVLRTPLQPHPRLSALTGCEVLLKREDLQAGRSYKVRGAYNLIAQLDAEEVGRGVVCASAGNHAQGVAFACAALGVRARIHLPRTTPRQKRRRVAAIGGEWVEIIVSGGYFDEAAEAARLDAARDGAVLVPPFDDARVVAGQGTVVREVVDQLGRAPDVLVVPVGGGGLVAGSVVWLAEHHPGTRVVAVEPHGAASLSAALGAGHPTTLAEVDTFVDGASVARVGELCLDLVRDRLDRVVTVPEGLVCVEMIDLYSEDGIIAEPAGALATAALRTPLGLEPGESVVCLVSGGNNDLSRYAEIEERALLHEGRKHYFMVDFPQQAGALRLFLDEVLGPDDDITLFEYVKRNNREVGPALVGIELGDPAELAALLARMEASPIHVTHLPPDTPVTRFLA